MRNTDLLDIYDVFIHVRFSIQSKETEQLLTVLNDVLYMCLKSTNGEPLERKRVRDYVNECHGISKIKFGSFDDIYGDSLLPKEENLYLLFFIITRFLKNKLANCEYKEAFKVVDEIHQVPLNLFGGKSDKVMLKLKKYVAKLLMNP